MYVKLENNIPVKWPIAEWEIRAQYPDSSLPEYMPDELALEMGYAPFIFCGYPPEYNSEWQNIEEIAPILKDKKYYQSYKITEKYSPEEKNRLIEEKIKAANKQEAQLLLQQTDWTATLDISDPQYSDPYLINQNEFLAYRSAVRKIAINPPTTPAVFPEQPQAIWSNQ